jgi:hypothetical protein
MNHSGEMNGETAPAILFCDLEAGIDNFGLSLQ